MSDWIEWKWTPEKPYPETLETMVDIRWVDGMERGSPAPVQYWEWDIQGNDTDITHYRIAEERQMTYDPNSARKGGSRKHLVETVIKEVEAHKHGKNSASCMSDLILAVRKYQKDSGGKK